MKKKLIFAALLFSAYIYAEELPEVSQPTGFSIIGWVMKDLKNDLYAKYIQENKNINLKGSVAKFMDWPNVSKIIVIYNAWHLPGPPKDIRINHIENNLSKANFGDKFKGSNPGGKYIFLFQYKNSDRNVVLCFCDGIFLIESNEGIGFVDIRKEH